jgi:hypothetical protein
MSVLFYVIASVIILGFAATLTITLLAMAHVIEIGDGFLRILFTKMILEVVAAGFFLFRSGLTPPPPPPPYVGSWQGRITWTPEYARRLFAFGGGAFAASNPRSEGVVHISVTRDGVYQGMSLWELKNGPDSYARLAVVPDTFTFDNGGRLTGWTMPTAFRQQLRPFDYAPFVHYEMKFELADANRISGRMVAYDEGGTAIDAGHVLLERH